MIDEMNLTMRVFVLSKEMKKTVNQITYFMFHIERCKKEQDKAKLLLIIAIKTNYVTQLVLKIKEEQKQLINLIYRSSNNIYHSSQLNQTKGISN